MGYRSDVMAVFYTYEANELPAIKLFIDENMPELFRGEFGGNDYMSTFETAKGLRGIKFNIPSVKWYPSYPEVRQFEQALGKFKELSAEVDSKWCCEFVRVGEEVEDIEEHQSYNAENLIYVSRTIESDV
jgi:hypothetical protein